MSTRQLAQSAEIFHSRPRYPSRAVISRRAFEHNLARARELAGDAEINAVVKADAYGHGAVQIAQWAVAAGVRWLTIAQLGEAIAVRRAGVTQPHILALIADLESDYAQALELEIDITVGSIAVLDRIAQASAAAGRAARVHLEVDTGMARGGVQLAQIAPMAQALAKYQAAGRIKVIGLWSHLAMADEPDSPVTAQQIELFEQASRALADAGITVQYRHLAASAGLLWHPRTHYSMVRPGIMLYGLSPNPAVATAQELGLEPVMRLEAQIASIRDVPAGTGVSYGHTMHTASATRLATIPLGYADGIQRSASNRAQVLAGGQLRTICGRVCMDQFVIEAPGAQVDDVVTLFGGPGAPSADEWAAKAGTIGYEIVTRIGPRVPRAYEDYQDPAAHGRKVAVTGAGNGEENNE